MGIYVPMFGGGQLQMYSQTMSNMHSASEVNLAQNVKVRNNSSLAPKQIFFLIIKSTYSTSLNNQN